MSWSLCPEAAHTVMTRPVAPDPATAATRSVLERLLRDDAPYGDLTTEALEIGALPAVMTFHARDAMVAALVEDAAAIVEIAGGVVDWRARSGDRLQPGAPILSARGPAGALLKGWKVAQTLIEIWFGVATSASEIVTAARSVSPDIAVACTRKHTPGVKDFAVAAVKAGGAAMHRMGLSETILVFPEHLAFLEGVDGAALVAAARTSSPEKKLVIEVKSIETGVAAAVAGFEIIQAEKFSPRELAELVSAVSALDRRPLIAAAGGVNTANAADYARSGADFLVTSAPYAAAPRDVAVKIAPQA